MPVNLTKNIFLLKAKLAFNPNNYEQQYLG